MKTNAFIFVCLFALSGCLTLSGVYSVTAEDKTGKPINTKVNMVAEGSGIYPVRNALCRVYPGAVIRIRNVDTNQELKSESPYHCSN